MTSKTFIGIRYTTIKCKLCCQYNLHQRMTIFNIAMSFRHKMEVFSNLTQVSLCSCHSCTIFIIFTSSSFWSPHPLCWLSGLRTCPKTLSPFHWIQMVLFTLVTPSAWYTPSQVSAGTISHLLLSFCLRFLCQSHSSHFLFLQSISHLYL